MAVIRLGKAIISPHRRVVLKFVRRSLLAGAAVSCLLAAGCETIDMAAQDIDESVNEASTQIKIDDSFESAAKKSEADGEWLNAAGYWQSLLDREPTNLGCRRVDVYQTV